MSRNLDEFLKQAARRRNRGAPPPVKNPQADVVAAELVIDDVSGDDVAAHVAQHLDSSGFEKRAAGLGDVVEQADEKVEAHLQEVFDHSLGQLSADETKTPTDAKASAPSAQSDLLALLKSPQSLRNAVILGEIFNRPEHRW